MMRAGDVRWERSAADRIGKRGSAPGLRAGGVMSVSDQDRRPFDLCPIDHTNETGIFESPVLAGIAHRAISIPDSPAMVHGSTIITYAELAERSDCLASGMREMGVGPETCVALCLERSPDFVTAALAVLKAGAGYLPLDPDTP